MHALRLGIFRLPTDVGSKFLPGPSFKKLPSDTVINLCNKQEQAFALGLSEACKKYEIV
jgi:hypothetical protein